MGFVCFENFNNKNTKLALLNYTSSQNMCGLNQARTNRGQNQILREITKCVRSASPRGYQSEAMLSLDL